MSAPDGIPGVTRRHRWSDLYHERTNFQFIKHTRRWMILSSTFMVLSVVLVMTQGLNFGIDFEGGTSWQVAMADGKTAKVTEVRDVLRPLGFADAKVSVLSGAGGQSVNVQEQVVADPIQTIRETLATSGRVTPADVEFEGDDEGGGSFTFTVKGDKPTEESVTKALASTELRGQTVKITGQNVVVTAKELPESPTEKVARVLAKYSGTRQEDVSISTVGPTWGQSVSRNAIRALIYFFILLALYLSVRFEFKMAVSSISAVLHDIVFTIGVYALFGFRITPATVTAFLTILGFSLYDTVVVFDKVRENQKKLTSTGRTTYGDMVNKSLNEVLMRSLSTSFVALMPVLSLLIVGSGIFGAKSLEDFALALAAGLFIGSYSSLFVAAPILSWWKEREPQYKALVERQARLGPAPVASRSKPPAPAPAMATVSGSGISDADDGDEPSDAVDDEPVVPVGVMPPRPIQPRPRQQRRRKRK